MLTQAWSRLRQRLPESSGEASFMALAIVVGVLAGLGASLLIWSVSLITDAFSKLEGPVPGIYTWVFISVPVGLWIAWWIASRFAPEVHGDGVTEVMLNLSLRGGHIRTRVAPLKWIATAITIGSGGSGGREGPIVQIGASIGSTLARWANLGEDRVRSLVAAGAGAGIGASFNAPIAGMLFAMEVILGNFSVRHLNAVVVASVAAAVTTRSLIGEELTFAVFPHRLADPRELILYAALGLLAVGAAYLFLRVIAWSETRADRLPLPVWIRPIMIGLTVAAAGYLSTRLPGTDGTPLVLGTGQDYVSAVLQELEGAAWWVLLVLAGLKILTTSGTLAARASGGAFMPSLFIGAALGAGFAKLVAPAWSVSELAPGAFALVGMAAVFAGVARAPLTSILIVFEITGDYRLILPLMLTTSLATFFVDRIHRESVYTLPLVKRGIRLVRTAEFDLLDTVLVGEVLDEADEMVARPNQSLASLQRMLDESKHHGLAVVGDGRLVGMVSITDIIRAGGPSDTVTVAEAMTPHPVTVTRNTPVSQALERMANLGIGRIPVVAENDPDHLIGMFRRVHAVDAYHRALEGRAAHELVQQRLRQRTAPGAAFFDFGVAPGSVTDGRAVREVSWPEGLTLVSVRRGLQVMIPTGNTVLRAGDIITAFGTSGSRDRLLDRLTTTMEFPIVEPPLQ